MLDCDNDSPWWITPLVSTSLYSPLLWLLRLAMWLALTNCIFISVMQAEAWWLLIVTCSLGTCWRSIQRTKVPRTEVPVNHQACEWVHYGPCIPTRSPQARTWGRWLEDSSAKSIPKKNTKSTDCLCHGDLLYSSRWLIHILLFEACGYVNLGNQLGKILLSQFYTWGIYRVATRFSSKYFIFNSFSTFRRKV